MHSYSIQAFDLITMQTDAFVLEHTYICNEWINESVDRVYHVPIHLFSIINSECPACILYHFIPKILILLPFTQTTKNMSNSAAINKQPP